MAGEGICQCPKRKRQVFVLMALLSSLFVGILYFFKGNVKKSKPPLFGWTQKTDACMRN